LFGQVGNGTKRVLRTVPPPEGLERRDAPAGLLAPGSSYSRHLPE